MDEFQMLDATNEAEVIADTAAAEQLETVTHPAVHRPNTTASRKNHKNSLRAGAELNELVAEHKLTPAGARVLTQVLDPFADVPRKAMDWPDGAELNTVSRPIKRTMVIKAPPYCQPSASNPNGLPWDCNIFTTQLCQLMPNVGYRQLVGNTVLSAEHPFQDSPLGTLNAICVPAGSPTFADPVSGATPPAYSAVGQYTQTAVGITMPTINPMTGQLAPKDTFTNGLHRVNGLAYEWVNTTPVLYQGGTQIDWESAAPVQQSTGFSFHATSGTYCPFPLNIARYQSPPATEADAIVIPGAQQKSARKGSYSVCTLEGDINPYTMATPRLMALATSYDKPYVGAYPGAVTGDVIMAMVPDVALASGQSSYGGWPQVPGIKEDVVVPLFIANTPNLSFHNFCAKGTYLTGLPGQTVLQVTLMAYVSTAPTPTDPGLLLLAEPSPPNDELFMRIYQEAVRRLPIAVDVDMNPLGEWFGSVVRAVGAVAAPIARNFLGAATEVAADRGVRALQANFHKPKRTVQRIEQRIAQDERQIGSIQRKTKAVEKKQKKMDQNRRKK